MLETSLNARASVYTMPWTRRELFQLSLLLLCVPVQYFISNYWSYNSIQRDQSFKSLISSLRDAKQHYLVWSYWKKFCLKLIYMSYAIDAGMDESPAIEVMMYRDKNGFFASSPTVRHSRPDNVKFRVGQLITHKIWGYSGVIIGWDDIAKAPDRWLKDNFPPEKQHWKYMPNYAVMVDIRDRPEPQITYVPQENLREAVITQVKHPKLEIYFSGFDGVQYLPRPWLRALYPAD